MASERILHVLSQRPSMTGSGVTLDAMVRCASARGYEQLAAVGTPASDPAPMFGGLAASDVRPLVFETANLPFPLPGMSDVMPYPSSRFSALDGAQVGAYLDAWRSHLSEVVAEFEPHVIHAHHVWLVSSLLRDVAPRTHLVVHCHATGIRQMQLAPLLANRVKAGCARADAFAVLHEAHAEALAANLGVRRSAIHVVGAGYRDDLFHARGRATPGRSIAYVGKLSDAKGLPQLIDAFERMPADAVLHVVGDGGGEEASRIRERMAAMGARVVAHGILDQGALATLLRRCDVCALPSFYEGVPLVLVEAFACGCRLVSTDLPGVVNELAPHLRGALRLVSTPRLEGPDVPLPEDLPAFVDALEGALREALAAPPLEVGSPAFHGALEPFSWSAVFCRIESIWRGLLADRGAIGLP